MTNRWIAAMVSGLICLAGVELATPAALAQEEEAAGLEAAAVEPDLAVQAGFDVVSKYFFRGILQEDQGVIVQPWAEAGLVLHRGDGAVRHVALALGTWNSLHDEHTGASSGNDVRSWYESDNYVGLMVGLGQAWEVGVTYHGYISPNSAFETVQEFDLSLSYDDSHCWEAMGVNAPGFSGLQPSFTMAFETDSTRFGVDPGIYAELAIGPSFDLMQLGQSTLTLSVPVTVGFSVEDYYETATSDDTFGFVDVGLIASLPLPTIPSELGVWTLRGGVHLLYLGSDHLDAVNNGDEFEVIGTVGLAMSF